MASPAVMRLSGHFLFCAVTLPRTLYSRSTAAKVRRSTVEVQQNISDAPHLRSFPPHPRTDFSKNEIAPHLFYNPMAQAYHYVGFTTNIGIQTIFG